MYNTVFLLPTTTYLQQSLGAFSSVTSLSLTLNLTVVQVMGVSFTATYLTYFPFIFIVIIIDFIFGMVGDALFCRSVNFCCFWPFSRYIVLGLQSLLIYNIIYSREYFPSSLIIHLIFGQYIFSCMCICSSSLLTAYLPLSQKHFIPLCVDQLFIVWCTTISNVCLQSGGLQGHRPCNICTNIFFIYGCSTSLLNISSSSLVGPYLTLSQLVSYPYSSRGVMLP